MYTKVCNCGTEFTSTGPAARYCEECRDIRKDEVRKQNRERNARARRANGCKIGRGAPLGELHPNYKHGFYVSQTQTRKYRDKVRYCERCSIDTWELSRWHWVTHHKDHNHSNHSESNLELLCKACHATEHEIHSNFYK
jgi:hypothetical protein